MSVSETEEDVPYYNRHTRHKFIRTVFCIMSVQLIVTLGIVFLVYATRIWCIWISNSVAYWYMIVAFMLVLCVMIACCRRLRHKFPINLFLLGYFTVAEGALLGGGTCLVESDSFEVAVIVTAIVCFTLSLSTMQTRWNFTLFRGFTIIFVDILIFLLIHQFFIANITLPDVYGYLGALVFSAYLVTDMEMILVGRHSYELEPDEYILGTLHLYVDIILVFILIYTIIMRKLY